MTYSVYVRRAAELDLAEGQVWCEDQCNGLGVEFRTEVSRIFDRLTETPLIYQIAYKDVRREIVHRFPYLVWYRVHGERVIVLASTHGRQDPKQTISRLG